MKTAIHRLVTGANLWKQSDVPDRQGDFDDSDEDFQTYRDRATASGLFTDERSRQYVALAASMATVPAAAHPDGPVVQVVKRGSCNPTIVVKFHPLRALADDIRGSQREAFCTLDRLWRGGHEIGCLEIHLQHATPTTVAEKLRHATAEDVARGISIWATLPCRIRKIVVYEPRGMRMAVWTARALLPVMLPQKVFRKLSLVKADEAPSEEWDLDGEFDRVVDETHVEDAHPSIVEEALEDRVEHDVPALAYVGDAMRIDAHAL